jgi:hypothetical protein
MSNCFARSAGCGDIGDILSLKSYGRFWLREIEWEYSSKLLGIYLPYILKLLVVGQWYIFGGALME